MRKRSTLVAVVAIAILSTGLTLHAAARRSSTKAPPAPPTEKPGPLSEEEEEATLAPEPASTHTELPGPPDLTLDLELDVPEEAHTPLPTKPEWAAALRFDLRHGSDCIGQRIREWVRIDCRMFGIQHVAAYAGETRDMHLGVKRVAHEIWESDERAIMMFPVRRGERRVIAATSAFFGRYSNGGIPDSGLLVTMSWPKGERAPTLRID